VKRLRVYLSSTFEDLKVHRAAVFAALERAGLEVARMEGYVAADERPLDLCLRDVAASDVYIGVLGWRYGYQPPASHGNPDGRSITELEFREAGRNHKPRLMFVAHPDTRAQWPPGAVDEVGPPDSPGARLAGFRAEVGTELTTSFFRTPDELATLVLAALLRSRVSGRPFNLPPRRPDTVARPMLTAQVRDALVSTHGREGSSTLLFGPGGFGKTNLALACAHLPEIVKAFPDGLLWTSLGEQPDLAAVLGDLHLAVTGERPAASGVRAIADSLSASLMGRRILLVVDDVWRADDLAPFLTLRGPRLLVTSRVQNLLAQVAVIGWAEIPVDRMDVQEAVALLGRGLEVDEASRAALADLAAGLGHWPLLLGLVNARLLEERRSWPSVADAIARVTALYRRKGVLGFDQHSSDERNDAVARSIEVGLAHVAATHAGIEARAAELAIFPEDTPVPIPVVASLWGLDSFDVEEDVIRPLDNICLLEWDRPRSELRLHDMIRRALQARLHDPAAAHGRLVDAWGDPRRLPHDYAWRHLAYHLRSAGRLPALRALLQDFDWLRAKLQATEVGALLSDFDALAADDPLRTVQGALWLASSYLAADKGQLASQLLGRLPPGRSDEVDQLRADIAAWRGEPWLRPLWASLRAPGGPLTRVFRGYAGGHDGSVRSIAIDAAGRRAVSAGNSSNDGAIIVWNLVAGTHQRLEGQSEAGGWTPLAITGGGDCFLSSHPGEVRAWRVGDGAPVATCRVPDDFVATAAVDDGGTTVIVGGPRGEVAIWNPRSGAIRALGVHGDKVADVAITPDGTRAVSVNEVDARLWDVDGGREIGRWPSKGYAAARWGRGVAISNDGRRVAWTAKDEGGPASALCEASEGQGVATRVSGQWAGLGIHAFNFHHGRAIVEQSKPSGDSTPTLLAFDGKPALFRLSSIGRGITCAAISRDGRWAVTADYEHDVFIWDLDRAQATRARRPPPPWHDKPFAGFADGGRYALFALDGPDPMVWDMAAEAPVTDAAITKAVLAATAADASRIDRQKDVLANVGMRVRPAMKKRAVYPAERIRGHRAPIFDRATSPDGRWEATASEDGTLRVWDLQADRLLAVFSDETIFSRCAWSPDSRCLAVVGLRDRTHLLRLEGVAV
jgi:WD40 repeat protein